MNEFQELHARQSLKDIWDAAKISKSNAEPGTASWLGELMAKISGVLQFDFDEEYPARVESPGGATDDL
jgi:hypothetical protein